MTRRFPRLYGDNSAFACFNFRARPAAIRKLTEDPDLAARILHGSDFPVPIFGHWGWAKGFMSWQNFRDCQRIRNPLERDYQLKRAMGFEQESFTRIWGLLRQPRSQTRQAEKLKPGFSVRG